MGLVIIALFDLGNAVHSYDLLFFYIIDWAAKSRKVKKPVFLFYLTLNSLEVSLSLRPSNIQLTALEIFK